MEISKKNKSIEYKKSADKHTQKLVRKNSHKNAEITGGK